MSYADPARPDPSTHHPWVRPPDTDVPLTADAPPHVDIAQLAARAGDLAPRLADYLDRTPLRRFDGFGTELGAEAWVKCEHLQRTGSFKARGSLAKLLELTPTEREAGVVTASSGNHGLGVAHALAAVGGHGLVFVPEGASPVKVAAIRRLGVEVWQQGNDAGAVEQMARRYAAEQRLVYVPPYNDPDVIAGQGTVGVELLEQLDEVGGGGYDAVVVSVGGGGLISGVASVLKQRSPSIRIIGASPACDAAMPACVRAGDVVEIDGAPTLSDGTAGNVEPGAITVELCRRLVDTWALVDESEIAAALRLVIETEHQLIEGAAALAFAAALSRRDELAGQRVGIVSCGANISTTRLVAALTD